MDSETMTAERFREVGGEEKVRVLTHSSCPVDVIRAGAVDADWLVQAAAVGNPNAPEDVIRAGVMGENLYVRRAAVGNPSAPEDVIRAGVRDENEDVREVTAKSLLLTAELADRLSKSKEAAIQRALAANPVVPERIRVVARMRAPGRW